MRRPRCLRRGQEAAYHCMSRTVSGQHLFEEREREVFRRRLWKLAAFCQVRIITYTCLSNHFHIVGRVPAKVVLSDAKLLQSLDTYYGPRHPKTLEFARVLGEHFAHNELWFGFFHHTPRLHDH